MKSTTTKKQDIFKVQQQNYLKIKNFHKIQKLHRNPSETTIFRATYVFYTSKWPSEMWCLGSAITLEAIDMKK